MTTLSTDNFTRADQSGLGTSSGGDVWAAASGSPLARITVNVGQFYFNGGRGSDVLGTQTTADIDILASCKIYGASDVMGPIFRYVDANNYYAVQITGSVINFDKVVSGTQTNIVSATVTGLNTTDFWWIHVNVTGTTIKVNVWKNGTSDPGGWLINTTDSTYTAAGKYGLGCTLSATAGGCNSLTVTDNPSSGVALSVTMAGVGTLAGTTILSTALASTLVGTGTLTGVFSLRIALSLTFAGTGTLTLMTVRPSHAQITLQAPRSKLSLQAPRGTITLSGE